MNNHTPGPWSWVYSDATFTRPIALSSDVGSHPDVLTASEDLGGPRAYVKAADAALIAAAPDLLEACIAAFNFVDDENNNKIIVDMSGSFGLWIRLFAAIKKATSEGGQP